jgi:hypothetical protein
MPGSNQLQKILYSSLNLQLVSTEFASVSERPSEGASLQSHLAAEKYKTSTPAARLRRPWVEVGR